jgi:hypothetical protein
MFERWKQNLSTTTPLLFVLAGKVSEDMIKKMEKSLRKISIWRRRRKKRVARKSSAIA